MERQGTHVTFLGLDMLIKDNIFMYNLINKRDKLVFFIVRMPRLSNNILSSIFYGVFYSKLLRIARCALLFFDLHQKHHCKIKWSRRQQ